MHYCWITTTLNQYQKLLGCSLCKAVDEFDGKRSDQWKIEGVKRQRNFDRAVQAPIFGDMGFQVSGMSEDVYNLNVWTRFTK